MGMVIRSFGATVRGLPLPTVQVVRTDSGPRWAALTEQMKLYYKRVAASAIDQFTSNVALASLRQVPKGPREDDMGMPRRHEGADEPGSLAASIRYPGNDYTTRCDPTSDYFSAVISYNTPYAVAQHEGVAEIVHHHPIIPGAKGFFEKTGVEAEITVEWRVDHYTTPGTKSHFLSDPFRERIPFMEEYVGRYVRERLL